MNYSTLNLKIFIIAITLLLLTKNEAPAQMFWNNACSFAGSTSSYLSRANSTELNITGSFTMEAWVNPVNVTSPTNQILIQKREGSNAVGYTLYLSSGKAAIRTNSTTRLVGKTVLSNNNWTHIAGTYNSISGLFSVYLNGSLDTSVIIAAAAPATSTDSLYIGKGFNSPFAGELDEIRIWNRNLSGTEVNQYRRTTLGTSSGVYSGLVLSATFQDNDANGTAFSLSDQSGNGNTLINRGATAVDLSNRPLQTININDCAEFDGADDYLAGDDAAALSPSSELTIEAWIFPRSYDKNNVLIHKGTDDGTTTDYALNLYQGKLQAVINNNITLTSDDDIPLNRWSHVAFTFDGINGYNIFYLNGVAIDVGINDKGFIIDGTDSLYIGGTQALTDFDGFVDEVRIKLSVKSESEINSFLFRSIDESNDLTGTEAVYNLDGYLVSNVGSTNRLYYRNNASFAHSGTINNQPLSPLNRTDDHDFQDGFYLKTSDRRIPESGTSGSMQTDTLNVLLNETITDVNVFVAINHISEHHLSISLVAPNGESVSVFNGNNLVTNSDNMVTLFDDDADSTIVNGRYVSFAPVIKPLNNMNTVFSGDNSFGKWRLVVNDLSATDTGRLYGWGIQFNNMTQKSKLFASRVLIEGFYNPGTNLMRRDTMRFYMRHTSAPYDIIDSAQVYLNNDGTSLTSFSNLSDGILYYIHLHHRNSIETWSSDAVSFDPLTYQASYDFTDSDTKAFGNNMRLVDNSPVRYAIFSGDVDKNGSVEAFDLSSIDNDAAEFLTGYVQTDITGDDIVEASDLSIADNNAAEFVTAIIPLARPYVKSLSDKTNQDQKESGKSSFKFALEQNNPNPFNPDTEIKFELPDDGFVNLKVFDAAGREIMILVNDYRNAGRHSVRFTGSGLSSGTYFLKLESGKYSEVKRMVLIK